MGQIWLNKNEDTKFHTESKEKNIMVRHTWNKNFTLCMLALFWPSHVLETVRAIKNVSI
jgi:hypothetical protein